MSETTRKVLRLSGGDVKPFLQGLVTNDVDRLAHGMVYTALLTPQGKYRADFFLIPDGDDVLLDVTAELAPGLVQALSMYKLRSDVTISETDITVSRGLGETPEGAYADPRHPTLGWRGYAGQPDQDVDWDALRVASCIPEGGIELGADSFVLEVGFERLNGVDFKKGCYVGQEVTARMKHKTELRKGLTLVGIDGSATPGTEITRDGKTVGQVFTQSEGRAIAYVRFDRLGDGMQAGEARIHTL